MASIVTPEKIRNVLSSFLLKHERAENELVKLRAATSDPRPDTEASIAEDTKSSKSAVLRSHKSFLKRLETFSASTWFSKPAELSPLICARYGWENVDFDMLQCVGCKTFLCGRLPMSGDSEDYNQCAEKLKKNIVASHERFCVFGTFPCSEEFCHVQVEDVVSLSASFCERASALSKIQDKLPTLNLQYLEDLGYDEGQAGAYCKRHLMPDKDISPSAVTLTFTGWTCSSTSAGILMCVMCCRKIGLWNFASSGANFNAEVSSEDESSISDEDQGPKRKRQKITLSPIKESFNPVEEHNIWCPWIQHHKVSSRSSSSSVYSSPSSSSESSTRDAQTNASALLQKIPAYIAALKSIAPGLMDNNTGLAAGMKKSPMTEGLRCFRRALETWSSPKASSSNSSHQLQQSPTTPVS
ncbi:nuclear-interacting partner of alk-like [Plakobranchus ocellatus]|uniref:Nuclear-interacting partner of alk-like n=1 Tax=Plakobranchus ocellatus TaxID=259542 RepID=A0AAV4B8E5_9GAST|nr:nuclear-interacting partner of alk-like [Plakobranchus ocellatus]